MSLVACAMTCSVSGANEEHWYTLEIAGKHAGHMHEVMTDVEGVIRTRVEQRMKITRGGIDLTITVESDFTETVDGRPLELRYVQDMSLQSLDVHYIFGPDGVTVRTRQGNRERVEQRSLPEPGWLTPAHAQRYWKEQVDAGYTSFDIKVISGETGLVPVSMHWEYVGDAVLDPGERRQPMTEWAITSSVISGVETLALVDIDGVLVEQRVALPFGEVVTRLATREEAMRKAEFRGPELMRNTFVQLEETIHRARASRTSELKLTVREGEIPLLPSAGSQTVLVQDDTRSLVLLNNISRRQPADSEDLEDASFRRPSAFIDSEDPKIILLARRACRSLEEGEDAYARCAAMHSFVHRYISSKSLSTGFATASETAQMQEGDCSEHAVLLAAMIRADGIPSRCATGLIYAEAFAGSRDIFGWHMWTQALVDGHWIDLDATLPVRFDAVHVLTSTSSMADGTMDRELGSTMMLIGNLDIEVLDIGFDP